MALSGWAHMTAEHLLGNHSRPGCTPWQKRVHRNPGTSDNGHSPGKIIRHSAHRTLRSLRKSAIPGYPAAGRVKNTNANHAKMTDSAVAKASRGRQQDRHVAPI